MGILGPLTDSGTFHAILVRETAFTIQATKAHLEDDVSYALANPSVSQCPSKLHDGLDNRRISVSVSINGAYPYEMCAICEKVTNRQLMLLWHDGWCYLLASAHS